jgi:hypothetical protein
MGLELAPLRTLLLGGYGFFGGRIAGVLAGDPNLQLIVAGRSKERASTCAAELQPHAARPVAATAIDVGDPDFAAKLAALEPGLVIHTGGPFQGQDHRVALACVSAGAHYVDLADATDFVSGIGALDAAARERGVLVVSGASSVPGLSSAVIARYRAEFSAIESLDIGITPGNRTARGLATVQAVLSYCGKPFDCWIDGAWRTVHGWQGLKWHAYPPPVGRRLLGYCDVPDRVLYPRTCNGVRTVEFRAGFELVFLQLGMWGLAWLRRSGIVADWGRHAARLKRLSEHTMAWGSSAGAMHVEIAGTRADGTVHRVKWYIVAPDGDGPQIPCTAAVVIARKLARDEMPHRGAMPCVDLFSVDEFMAALEGFNVHETAFIYPGDQEQG